MKNERDHDHNLLRNHSHPSASPIPIGLNPASYALSLSQIPECGGYRKKAKKKTKVPI
jgi:hypothetical protein